MTEFSTPQNHEAPSVERDRVGFDVNSVSEQSPEAINLDAAREAVRQVGIVSPEVPTLDHHRAIRDITGRVVDYRTNNLKAA